ncbi:MAG: Xanthine/uracil permease [Deltaproteobacteria bacterium]|nr:Xanthine/uracil permease [Deltaproteobacteria bacterium]
MAKKPANLIYGVNESPGFLSLVLLGLQHIFVLSIAFIFPVVIVDSIHGTPDQAQNLISMAMFATGIATILQGLNKGYIGSGYLCPLVNGPAFLSASLLAGKTGGLSLIFGMTAIGGIFEGVFSRLVLRLRAVFPAEVTGTIVMMVGIEIIPVAVVRFLGVDAANPSPVPSAIIVGFVTLFTMIGFNIWGKGKFRLYSVLIGMAVGYSAAFLAGELNAGHLHRLMDAPAFQMPSFGHYGLSFDIALLVPFLVASLSSALKTMGDLTICQKINDAEWKRPDMGSISRGILANAAGNVISGITGALGQSVSSSNVGLSIATGAASRTIAYSIGAILIVSAFVPKLASIFVIMPTPVMGASLVFAASFMILAGIQILMSRMMDPRKTFVIGLSVVFGLSIDLMPDLFKNVHPWIKPFFSSSLSLATISVIILNVLLRIGVARSAHIELRPGVDSSDTIFDFMERHGSEWGAFRDVVQRCASVINEFFEFVSQSGLARERVNVEITFDEFNLDAHVSYTGQPVKLSGPKQPEKDLLNDEYSLAELSSLLIHKNADSIKSSVKGEQCLFHFHFEH